MSTLPFNLDAALETPSTRWEKLQVVALAWLSAAPTELPKLMWVEDRDFGWLLRAESGLVLGRVSFVATQRQAPFAWSWEVLPQYAPRQDYSAPGKGHYSTCDAAKRVLRRRLPAMLEFRLWWLQQASDCARGQPALRP